MGSIARLRDNGSADFAWSVGGERQTSGFQARINKCQRFECFLTFVSKRVVAFFAKIRLLLGAALGKSISKSLLAGPGVIKCCSPIRCRLNGLNFPHLAVDPFRERRIRVSETLGNL